MTTKQIIWDDQLTLGDLQPDKVIARKHELDNWVIVYEDESTTPTTYVYAKFAIDNSQLDQSQCKLVPSTPTRYRDGLSAMNKFVFGI